MVAATGIGSGLDIESLVTQLVAAERVPAENRLFSQEAELTNEISAFGTLQGALANLQANLTALTLDSTFNQRSATTSNSTALNATATSAAAPGTLSVQVDQLAQAQSLASNSFASLTEEVGTGTLTLRFGTVDVTPEDSEPQTFNSFTLNADSETVSVQIDSSNNTLEGVRDAINDADAGVSAAIVNDGSGFRLLLSSENTGENNAIEVQVTDTGDSNDTDTNGLSRLAFNDSANNLTQTVAGRDANFSINGLDLTSSSNSVSDVLTGVSLNLNETTDAPVSLTISQNEGAARAAIEAFVGAYNTFVEISNGLTAYDAENDAAGPLQGDFSARSIVSQLRAALGETANGFDGPFSTLTELGIRTQADGTLSIDDATLSEAIADNFDSIQGVFADFGAVTNSGVTFDSATNATQPGSYAVEITQAATQSLLQAAVITAPSGGTPLVIDDNNNTLSLIVDGISSASISLTQGSYSSGAELAAELQSRINGDSELSAAGAAVTVSFTADNRFEITSNRFGSESEVQVTAIDTNTTSQLGFAIGSGSAGQDVAGTIGGVAATGNGQILTAAEGSNAEGISLTITSTDTGSLGSINFSTGIATSLNGLLEGFLGSDGLIGLRTDGLQTSIDRIAEDREDLEFRLDALEARYRRQFNALDSLLASLQTTGDFLTSQLASIPLPGSNNDN